jgi:hypothetical protein
MLIGPVHYILATERLQGPVFTALLGCRATALPLKREVAPTLVVARLMAATSVVPSLYAVIFVVQGCPDDPRAKRGKSGRLSRELSLVVVVVAGFEIGLTLKRLIILSTESRRWMFQPPNAQLPLVRAPRA